MHEIRLVPSILFIEIQSACAEILFDTSVRRMESIVILTQKRMDVVENHFKELL